MRAPFEMIDPTICAAFLSSPKEFITAFLFWPTLPLVVLWMGIRASRRARLPSSGIGTELFAFCLRAVSVGALLSPAFVGNKFIALPLPSLWVLASSSADNPAATPNDLESVEFAVVSLQWCIGLSFLVHFVVGMCRTKHASIELDTD